jgi:hypothetical protein
MTKKSPEQSPSAQNSDPQNKPLEAEATPATINPSKDDDSLEKEPAPPSDFPLYTIFSAAGLIALTFIVTSDTTIQNRLKSLNLSPSNVENPAVSGNSPAQELSTSTQPAPSATAASDIPLREPELVQPAEDSDDSLDFLDSLTQTPPDDTPAITALTPETSPVITEEETIAPQAEAEPEEEVPSAEETALATDALTDRLQKLTIENYELKKSLKTLETLQEAMALTLATRNLYDDVTTGRNFEKSLTSVLEITARPLQLNQELTKLSALPIREVITLPELTARFKQLSRDFLENREVAGVDDSLVGKTLKNLSSSITIRKVGTSHAGNDDASILARAEALLEAGDIVYSIREAQHLSREAAAFFEGWIITARDHVSANNLAKRVMELGAVPTGGTQ